MKSVTFNPTIVRVARCPHRLSEIEINNMWYSSQELEEIHENCNVIERGSEVAKESVYLRGLELANSRKEIDLIRKDVIGAVLAEQKRLKGKKTDVEEIAEKLAKLGSQRSEQRIRVAHLRAIQDAQIVQGSIRPSISNVEQIRARRRSERQGRNRLNAKAA